MDFRRLTGTGRPLDFSYPTNRWIVAISTAAGIVAAVIAFAGGESWIASMVAGGRTGALAFLAWALGRELDPDHPISAFVAAGLMLAAIVVYEAPSVWLALWLLMGLRIVNHTTGLPPTVADSAGFLILTGFTVTWSMLAAIVCASAFVLNAWLGDTNGRNLTLAAASLVVAALPWAGVAWLPTVDALVAAVAVAVVFGAVILRYRVVTSRGDATNTPLDPTRVRAAQGLALMTVLFGAAALGIRGLVDLAPVVSAMIAAVPFSYSRVV